MPSRARSLAQRLIWRMGRDPRPRSERLCAVRERKGEQSGGVLVRPPLLSRSDYQMCRQARAFAGVCSVGGGSP